MTGRCGCKETPGPPMHYLLTSDPGLEQLSAEEARECDPSAEVVHGADGIRIETRHEQRLFALRTIHHIVRIRHECRAATLEAIGEALERVGLPELERAASFRVTSHCTGDAALGRAELAGMAGAALKRRYGTAVDLEQFAVNVRVDLHDDRLMCGVQLTRESLGHRIHRREALRTALRPTVAAAMLRLAGADRGTGRLIDPMCGAATIPIEAHRLNPQLAIAAADWDRPTVELARRSLTEHGVEVDLEQADARSLGNARPASFDYIVTDPPYGVRQAKRTSIARLYGALLPSFERALTPVGRIVLLVVKYRTFVRVVETSALEIVGERRVELGGLEARIVVMERKRRTVADCTVPTG